MLRSMPPLMLPYREPAEDEEAKLDAAEVDGFRRAIAAQKRRQNLRVVLYALGCAAALAITGWILARRSERTIGLERRRGCHEIVDMRFEDGEMRSNRVLVCPDAGAK